MAGEDFVWVPSEELKAESRLGAFLREHGIADYAAMKILAASDPNWFWDAIVRFFDLRFETRLCASPRPIRRNRVAEMVRWWTHQPDSQLPRSPHGNADPRPPGDRLGGGGRRDPQLDVREAQCRDLPPRRRTSRTRDREGRCGRPVHADGPGDGRGLPRDRQDRRGGPSDVLRIRRCRRSGTYAGCGGERRHHRRRDDAPRARYRDEVDHRRGCRQRSHAAPSGRAGSVRVGRRLG